MDKVYKAFIATRCNEALMQSEDYIKKENDEDAEPEELQAMAEELCYIKGARDMLRLIMNDTQEV